MLGTLLNGLRWQNLPFLDNQVDGYKQLEFSVMVSCCKRTSLSISDSVHSWKQKRHFFLLRNLNSFASSAGNRTSAGAEPWNVDCSYRIILRRLCDMFPTIVETLCLFAMTSPPADQRQQHSQESCCASSRWTDNCDTTTNFEASIESVFIGPQLACLAYQNVRVVLRFMTWRSLQSTAITRDTIPITRNHWCQRCCDGQEQNVVADGTWSQQ